MFNLLGRKKFLYFECDRGLEKAAQGGCAVSCGDNPNPSGLFLCQLLRWSCFDRELDYRISRGPLPTPAIPQFSNTNLSWTESIVSWTKRSCKLLLKVKWQFSYHLNVFENFNHDSTFISSIFQMPPALNSLP